MSRARKITVDLIVTTSMVGSGTAGDIIARQWEIWTPDGSLVACHDSRSADHGGSSDCLGPGFYEITDQLGDWGSIGEGLHQAIPEGSAAP